MIGYFEARRKRFSGIQAIVRVCSRCLAGAVACYGRPPTGSLYTDYVHGYDAVEQDMGDHHPITGIGAISALVDVLRPLDDAKVRMLRSAVHEMRTPLTAVTGFIELLGDDSLGPMTFSQHLVLEALGRNIQDLTEFVDALEPTDPGSVRESAPS